MVPALTTPPALIVDSALMFAPEMFPLVLTLPPETLPVALTFPPALMFELAPMVAAEMFPLVLTLPPETLPVALTFPPALMFWVAVSLPATLMVVPDCLMIESGSVAAPPLLANTGMSPFLHAVPEEQLMVLAGRP